MARTSRAAFLVDAEIYYRAFAAAAARAVESIVILAWDFDSRTQLALDPIGSGAPVILGEFLNFLVQRRRRLSIHILNWDYPMLFSMEREMRPIYGLDWKPHRRVHLCYDNTHPVGGSHHQKIVVIDDAVAFSGGLDLTLRRWDTRAHIGNDPRRVTDGDPYEPFHDAMVAVDGEAARALGDLARERWRLATHQTLRPVRRGSNPWPPELHPDLADAVVAISRTVPKTQTTNEVREVEALYLDMIAAAKRYIYMENQYFTSRSVGDALAARLGEANAPEIVLVTRLLSHGWLEENTMHTLRNHLVRQLRQADKHNRFKVYYPYVPGLAAGTCINCHSKLMAVDDEWLRIGSSNLSNRSMGLDTECDLTFEALGDARVMRAIRDFRDGLLGEHLGASAERVQAAIGRSGSLFTAIRELKSDERRLELLPEPGEESEAKIELVSLADPERPVALDHLIGQVASEISSRHSRPAWGKLALLACFVAGLVAIWRYSPLAELITADRVMGWARAVADVRWAPLALMVAYTPAAFVMFPRPLITLFAVIAFGPMLGFVYALAGILASAIVTYCAGCALPRHTVRRLAGEKLDRMSEVLRQRGLLAVFAVRIVPVAPFVVEGMIAGAIGIRLWHFTLGTLLGMLPGTLTTTVFGDQLQTALEDSSRINYWLVGGIVLFFIVTSVFVRRWFRKEHHLVQGESRGVGYRHGSRR